MNRGILALGIISLAVIMILGYLEQTEPLFRHKWLLLKVLTTTTQLPR